MGIFRKIADLLSNTNATKSTSSPDFKLEIAPYTGKPFYFGYKSCWYVVKTSQTNELAKYIQELNNDLLKDSLFRVPGWQVTISANYNGWTFLFCELNGDSPEGCNILKAFLIQLSKEFTEAQFFGTHRVVEYHCWAKAVNGELIRLYSYVGESGENICITGAPTEAESKYNLENTLDEIIRDDSYYENNNITFADESIVMEIAGKWSYDPTKFSKEDLERIWTSALTVTRVK
jgi:hypothetical protein